MSDNKSFLKKINLEINSKKFLIYKLNKSPITLRFIILASKCSAKPFSKSGFTKHLDAVIIFLNATAVKLIYKQIKNFNFKIQYCSGIKTFWAV